MNLECNGARVIIRPDGEDTKSIIKIPERFQKVADRGTVVVVGEGRRHIDGKVYPLKAKPGDRVIFSLVQIMRFENDGEKLIVCEEDAILVYLRPEVGNDAPPME